MSHKIADFKLRHRPRQRNDKAQDERNHSRLFTIENFNKIGAKC